MLLLENDALKCSVKSLHTIHKILKMERSEIPNTPIIFYTEKRCNNRWRVVDEEEKPLRENF